MKKTAFALLASLLMTAAVSCAKNEEKKKEEMTLKERAAAVGKFGDSVMTKGLEEKLPDIVEKNEERIRELDEAAGD